jgi:hypothetical protein
MVQFLAAFLALSGPATYSYSTESFANPERGFHTTSWMPWGENIEEFEVTPQAWTAPLVAAEHRRLREIHGVTVHAIRYNIAAFRAAPLSADFLNRVDQDFAAAREAGIKLIVRFAYGWLGRRPDAPKERIVSHIGQIRPVLRRNEDVLCHLDAGFVGYWGEWHASTHGLLIGDYQAQAGPDAREIAYALLRAVPPSRMVTFRYPRHRSQLFNPRFFEPGASEDPWNDGDSRPSAVQAFSGIPVARAGSYIDSFLSDPYDMSYGWEGNPTGADVVERRSRLTNRFVVQSGELDMGLGNTATLNRGPRALARLEKFRWSLINAVDSTPDAWAPFEGQIRNGHRIWRDDRVYDTIAKRLGYRIRLVRSDLRIRGRSLSGYIVVRNTGFASPFNPRALDLVLRNAGSGQVHRVPLLTPRDPANDPRLWLPDRGEITVRVQASLPRSVTRGSYRALLHLPDPAPKLRHRPEYAIRLANVGVWEPSTGMNRLDHLLSVQ